MNIKLYVFSWVMLSLASVSVNIGKKAMSQFDETFDKGTIKKFEFTNADAIDSKLNDLYLVHKEARSTVCQQDCKCPGNPYLFMDNKDIGIN